MKKIMQNIITVSKKAVDNWCKEFKQAIRKNFFSMKFLKQTAYLCLAISWICGIVLAFMSSTKTGWWTLSISFVVLVASLIACDLYSKDPLKEKMKCFVSIIFVVGICAIVSYLTGFIAIKLVASFLHAPSIHGTTEEILLLGFGINGTLALIASAINKEYYDGKMDDKWENKAEYLVCWIKRLFFFILACGIIFAFFYYLKPLLNSY